MADTDMRSLLERLYSSFGSGDSSVWTDNLADDVLGIGSDPDEWWEGSDLVAKVGAEQVRQMSAAGIALQLGDRCRVFHAGDVEWAVDNPTILLPDGTGLPARFTVVASREGSRLRIRHFHLSTGVTNEESIGTELPTS